MRVKQCILNSCILAGVALVATGLIMAAQGADDPSQTTHDSGIALTFSGIIMACGGLLGLASDRGTEVAPAPAGAGGVPVVVNPVNPGNAFVLHAHAVPDDQASTTSTQISDSDSTLSV